MVLELFVLHLHGPRFVRIARPTGISWMGCLTKAFLMNSGRFDSGHFPNRVAIFFPRSIGNDSVALPRGVSF